MGTPGRKGGFSTTRTLLTCDAGVVMRAFGSFRLSLSGRNLATGQSSQRPYRVRPNAPRWIQDGVKAEF